MPNGHIGSVFLLTKESLTLRSFNCQQKLTFSLVPTQGNFKLTLNGATTGNIPFDANANTVRIALDNIDVEATVTGDITSGFLITFIGSLASQDVSRLVVTDNTLERVVGAVTTSVSIVVSFTGRGRDSLGIYQEGSASDTTIVGSVQPLSGEDYRLMPEADRLKDVLELYTKSEIKEEQLIVRNNIIYTINKIELWYGYFYCWLVRRKPL